MKNVSVNVTKYLQENGIISNDLTIWVFRIGEKEYPIAGFFGEALSHAHYLASGLLASEIELIR